MDKKRKPATKQPAKPRRGELSEQSTDRVAGGGGAIKGGVTQKGREDKL